MTLDTREMLERDAERMANDLACAHDINEAYKRRIEELEAMLVWARDVLRAYQINGVSDITRLLAKGKT